jgi:hypothetical protein
VSPGGVCSMGNGRWLAAGVVFGSERGRWRIRHGHRQYIGRRPRRFPGGVGLGIAAYMAGERRGSQDACIMGIGLGPVLAV